jgi:thiamine-phosphate pyrophosphorylase
MLAFTPPESSPAMRGLYAIVDTTALRARAIDPVAFARAVLDARPAALQLRAKDLPEDEFLTLLRAIAPLCRDAGVSFVANDRADLGALAGCDGVHLGQEDLAIEDVRRVAPGLRVGLSTHTPEQLVRALGFAPAYVAYGPVFATASKAKPDPVVGLLGLQAAAALARRAGVPLVAIGGISLERAAEVGAVADVGAVIAGLLPPPGAHDSAETVLAAVTARAVALHAALSAPDTREIAAGARA